MLSHTWFEIFQKGSLKLIIMDNKELLDKFSLLVTDQDKLIQFALKVSEVNKRIYKLEMPCSKENIANIFLEVLNEEERLLALVGQSESVGQLFNFLIEKQLADEFGTWKQRIEDFKSSPN